MPYSAEHKARTRASIVASARRLFNARGLADVSIDEIMAGAGLTRGGFYNHFASKDELYVEAVTDVMRNPPARNWDGYDMAMNAEPPVLARHVIDAYLSPRHLDDEANLCPLIALPGDVARSSDEVRDAFHKVAEAMIFILARGLADSTDPARIAERRPEALAMAASCVGALVLARGVGNEKFADKIRGAVHTFVVQQGGWEEIDGLPRRPASVA